MGQGAAGRDGAGLLGGVGGTCMGAGCAEVVLRESLQNAFGVVKCDVGREKGGVRYRALSERWAGVRVWHSVLQCGVV